MKLLRALGAHRKDEARDVGDPAKFKIILRFEMRILYWQEIEFQGN